MIETGTVLNGRYEIVRLIAEGGMGAVYEGRDLKFGGGPVAIKRCLMNGEAMQRAFVREAELLANLSHPGVAKARDLFSEPDGQYLVMELIPGNDLEQILSDRGAPLPTEVALEWMDQTLDALSYMHGRRPPVIHRDIKPSNLKLTPSGHVMLIDFGLAKGNGTTSLAGYSANFAPLEQLQGDGTDARSDLYALGATLYRLLTGRAPESALDRVKQLAKGQRDPLLSVHTINSLAPEAVAQVIWDAMALEPEDRLQSADEMRRRLREAGDSLASSYQWAYAPTQCDEIIEKNSRARSVRAGGKSTVPFTERLSQASSISNRSASISKSSVAVEPVRQVAVETSNTRPKYAVGKYILASGCLVALLFLGVAGNSYRNWRIEQARVQQQEIEQRKDFLPQVEQVKVPEQQPVEPPPQTVSLDSTNQESLRQKEAEDRASLETTRRKREAAAREADRLRQVAAAREAEKLRQETAAREAERLKQEMVAREAERLKQEAAAREAERHRQEVASREAEKQRQETAARELEKQKAAWEAERLKAAREAEKQKAAWEAERLKAAREAEKQRKETAAREAEIAKRKLKAEAADRKEEKEAKETKETKKQKKRDEEKENVGRGVRVGVSILGGIIRSRQNKP
jgi:serine/threonine protein kinase